MTPALDDVLLEGRSVRLRPVAPADAGPAFELVHAREPVLRWLVWSGPRSVDDLVESYRHWRVGDERADDYHLAIRRRSDDAFLGGLSLRHVGHPGTGDLGYWLGERHQGRGYGTEAVGLAAHLAFRWLDTEVLCAWVFVGNHASRAVLEKNGFRRVRTGTRRLPDGRRVEEWYLTLLRPEWEASAERREPTRDEVRLAPGP